MKRSIVVLCLVLSACGDRNTSVIDQQVLEEIQQRELRHVLPNQIVNEAYRRGEGLARQLLASALDHYPAEDSLTLASLLAQQSYDTLTARVAWIDARSDTTRLTSYEQQLWGAYRYSAEQGDPLADNVQRLKGDSLLYTQPVVLADSLAARFSASADTVGQLIGMWSITLPKKEVVLSIE